ncbi:hypothetical protein GGD61_008279 [Bradyrhizobium sp. SBR1B]|nr:hypothetical protein [Bradyrhizobium sp. SBR1B]
MPKLAVLTLEGLQLLGHVGRNAGPLPAIDLGLLDPVMQRLRRAADLGRDHELYRPARLFVNFFQPSFKPLAKQRDGARVRKTYSAPGTPHQRLAADARTPDAVRHHVQELYAALDPVALLRDIRDLQERLAALADTQPIGHPAVALQPIDRFLASLRTAWKDGAMRPTDRPLVKAKRGRRRPDPLIQATPDLLKWFEAEPWRTGSELLSRLQMEYPGAYPNKLLRTLQRRLKSWRSEQANALLFAPSEKMPPGPRPSPHPASSSTQARSKINEATDRTREHQYMRQYGVSP